MRTSPLAQALLLAAGLASASASAQGLDGQRLVGGAPLFDPDVAVHTVEKKQFKDASRSELVLYPVVPQLNGEFTQHYGSVLTYVYHLQETFGLMLSPVYNWYDRSSGFNRELNNAVSGEARPASSLLLKYGAWAGVEVAPLYGKFAFYQLLARFQVVLHGGVGVGSTEHELKEGNAYGPTTYGDTGAKLLMAAGAGLRFQVGSRFTLRLEVNDLAYAARVSRVNGCSQSDLATLVAEQGQGLPLAQGSVGAGCRVGSFVGVDKSTGYQREADLRPALDLTSDNASDVLNNLGFYAGVGFAF